MKNFEFEIKKHKWKVEIIEEQYLLEEYHKRQPDAYACMGLTFYKEHKIWIASELCEDEKIRTLKHELTHCYIWENGFYNVDFNNEELVCDFIASISDFIIEILNKLQELKGSNEPSFEEMVGFVENVYKDIKSQSTLHEELEKERKTIAKIVGDFKEVNK